MTRFLVDGMNVIGSKPDGWWRDRNGAVRRFVTRLQRLMETSDHDVTVVFDGRPVARLAEGAHIEVQVLYARRAGPDAADDRIVEMVTNDGDPGSLLVVTSDQRLAQRVRVAGAEVESVTRFTARLDEPVV